MKPIASLLSLAVAMLPLCACAGDPSAALYRVQVPVTGSLLHTTAYLEDYDTGLPIDSAVIESDTVVIQGQAPAQPLLARVMLEGGTLRGPVLVLEPGRITAVPAQLTASGIDSVGGTQLNDRFQSYTDAMEHLRLRYNSLDRNDSLQAVTARVVLGEYQALPRRAWGENSRTPIGLYWYLQDICDKPLEQLEDDTKHYPVLASSASVASHIEARRKQQATGPGTHYLDFATAPGKGHAPDSLSAHVSPGRYTLVCFLASWSSHTPGELATVRSLWERYHVHGLDVVEVAVWEEPASTLAALEASPRPWHTIVGAQTVPTDLYGIQGVPSTMLIGPDGKIVARDITGGATAEAVAKAMEAFTPPAPGAGADSPGNNIPTSQAQ